MILPPLEVIEAWPTPNYVDPVTRGPAPIIFNLVLFPLVCFFLGLRMFTRLHISKSFGVDDWLILATLLPTSAFAAISLVAQFRFGWNKHVWDVDPTTLSLGLKLILTSIIIFDVATSLTKLSMLTLTYRIIGDSSKTLRKATIGVMAVVSLQGTIFVFTEIFQCRPLSQYWTLSLTPQTCVSEPALLLSAGIINTITDFLVVTLPIPVVWKLKMGGKEQIVLVLLFGTGFLVSIAGGVRTYYTYIVTVSNDRTWAIFPVWLTASVELYVGIVCACIPATKKFFSHYMPRVIGSQQPSQATISMETKQTPSTSQTNIQDVELAIAANHSRPLPYEGKDIVSTNVEDFTTLNMRLSGFEFGLKRSSTPRSSRANVDGMDKIAKVESHERLITSASCSPMSQDSLD